MANFLFCVSELEPIAVVGFFGNAVLSLENSQARGPAGILHNLRCPERTFQSSNVAVALVLFDDGSMARWLAIASSQRLLLSWRPARSRLSASFKACATAAIGVTSRGSKSSRVVTFVLIITLDVTNAYQDSATQGNFRLPWFRHEQLVRSLEPVER
ncbi:MAG: hypothetical protein ACI8X5_000868 [Planctomycetota bacterium]